jgi:hypothetical protein
MGKSNMKKETMNFLENQSKLNKEEKESLIRSIVNKPAYNSRKHKDYDASDFELWEVKGEPGNTARGFSTVAYKDMYGEEFCIQSSSLATDDAIWFGISDAKPKVLASQATSLGVETTQQNGWVPYPLPEEVLLNTRMHLNREQVLQLLPVLIRFVETGEL